MDFGTVCTIGDHYWSSYWFSNELNYLSLHSRPETCKLRRKLSSLQNHQIVSVVGRSSCKVAELWLRSTDTPSLDTKSNPINAALFTWGSSWAFLNLRVTGGLVRQPGLFDWYHVLSCQNVTWYQVALYSNSSSQNSVTSSQRLTTISKAAWLLGKQKWNSITK